MTNIRKSWRLRHDPFGFTFIELLVVLGVLAMLAGIATPSLMSRVLESEQEQVLEQVRQLFNRARCEAVACGQQRLVEYVGDHNELQIRTKGDRLKVTGGAGEKVKFPPDFGPSMDPDDRCRERKSNTCVVVVFYSNGTATPRVLKILRSGRVFGQISLDRATGRVSVRRIAG